MRNRFYLLTLKVSGIKNIEKDILNNIGKLGDGIVEFGDTTTVNFEAYTKAAKEAENPAEFLAEKEQEYSDLFANPYQAAKYGYIDDVIEPRNTRFRICRALAQLATKRESLPAKKHGNIPM